MTIVLQASGTEWFNNAAYGIPLLSFGTHQPINLERYFYLTAVVSAVICCGPDMDSLSGAAVEFPSGTAMLLQL